MSKEAYYFSHDSNARNDEKVLMLRAEHGMEGYGIYWVLLEMMFESSDTKLFHNKTKGIAVSCNIDITVLQGVINTAISEELFVSDGEKFWSESLIRRKGKFHEAREKKSLAGKKGMAKRWGNKDSDNNVITKDNTVITENNKGKEKKEKEKKIKEIPPYEEIIDYLNMRADKNFKCVESSKKLILKRWEEGQRLDDFKTVIDNMVANWQGVTFTNGKLGSTYLQPSTLFAGKFEEYRNQVPKRGGNGQTNIFDEVRRELNNGQERITVNHPTNNNILPKL